MRRSFLLVVCSTVLASSVGSANAAATSQNPKISEFNKSPDGSDPLESKFGATAKLNSEENDYQPREKVVRVRKRSYNPWSAQRRQLSIYEANSIWKPPVYQLSRPYYIPVYGAPNRMPIFYPPQPLNPGFPQDNPPKPPFKGPTYLPPEKPSRPTYLPPDNSTERPDSTTMKIIDRFNEDEDDDAPVWGDGTKNVMQLSGDSQETIPTRPSIGSSGLPPLVHKPSRETPQAQSSPSNNRATSGPSNCVWAIISCCSATDPRIIPENCFEQRGCAGPFWGASPCDSDFARAAIESAVNYYGTNS